MGKNKKYKDNKNSSASKQDGQSNSPATKESQRGSQVDVIPVGHLEGIEGAGTWNLIVEAICEHLKIPDLTSRKGLKQVHKTFGEINAQLKFMYSAANSNDKIRGGVVAIWGKISADAILQKKLFNDGFTNKLFALLDKPNTRQLALQVISTVTHHGDVGPRRSIALKTPRLLAVMKEELDNSKIMELVTVTMSHAIGALIHEPTKVEEMKKIELGAVLQATTENLKKPTASYYMLDHALGLLASATGFGWAQCEEVPAVATFLIACLRSSEITTRSQAVGALIRLHANGEQDIRFHDPQKLMAAVSRRWPEKLMGVMMAHGFERCDTPIILRTTGEYQKAMMQAVRDRDLCALGRRLASMILQTEFSIAEGGFQALNEKSGQYEFFDTGLPFKMWTEALPHCAKALREGESPVDFDMADIMDIKFHIIRQRISEAVVVSEKAINRNPDLAYAYYAIGLGADPAKGLRAAKKGLKCTGATPFMRNYLLWRAVDHAGNMGVSLLHGARNGEKEYSEGIAFLMSALEDAKTFVEEAPPDSRNMQMILNWYIILATVVEGPKLNTGLDGLKKIFEKAEMADEFSTFLGVPPKKTQLRLTRELIVQKYAAATAEWTDVIARFDRASSSAGDDLHHSNAEDELEKWLENIQEDDEGHEPEPACDGHKKASATNVELYRCSWCRNPSAILRKCGGCSQTRYCDSGCQKAHWKQHKTACDKTRISGTG